MTGVFIVPEQRKVTCSVLFYFRLVPEAFKCEPMHRKGKPYHLFSHIFRPEFVKYNWVLLKGSIAKCDFEKIPSKLPKYPEIS